MLYLCGNELGLVDLVPWNKHREEHLLTLEIKRFTLYVQISCTMKFSDSTDMAYMLFDVHRS